MQNITIRKATLEDAFEIRLFFKNLYEENLETLFKKNKTPSIIEVHQTIEKIYDSEGVVFAAELLNNLVGLITVKRYQNPQMSHSVYFGISVLKKFRNHGIGTKLLNEVKFWASKNNVMRIELEVFSNNMNAIRLYRRENFIIEGVKKKAILINGKYFDILEMVYFVK